MKSKADAGEDSGPPFSLNPRIKTIMLIFGVCALAQGAVFCSNNNPLFWSPNFAAVRQLNVPPAVWGTGFLIIGTLLLVGLKPTRFLWRSVALTLGSSYTALCGCVLTFSSVSATGTPSGLGLHCLIASFFLLTSI